MSKEVKRYDPFGYDGLSALMHEDELGDWVRAEDYDALLAERNALKQLLAETRTSMIQAIHWEDLTPVKKRIDAALQGEQPCT